MAQLLLSLTSAFVAILLFVKSEVPATQGRVLRGTRAKMMGAAFAILAPLGWIPGGALVWFVANIVVAVVAIVVAQPVPPPLGVAPARAPEPAGPQLSGATCAVCGRRFVTAAQGFHCRKCQAPVHHGCSKAHRASHRDVEGASAA